MTSSSLEQVPEVKRPPVWRRPMYRAVQKVQRNVWGRWLLEAGCDPADTLYVVGSGRSGTSWLAELLNYRNDHRYMFEPLTPPHVPAFSHFIRGQYLRSDNRDPAYGEPLAHMLSGRLRHRWVDHLNCTPIVRRRLIKDVYANLLLPWVSTNFPTTKIVMVIRHPLAVTTSRMKLKNNDRHRRFEPELDRYLRQDDLMADFLAPHEAALRGSLTVPEQYAFWWSIENALPLQLLPGNRVHLVLYERLLKHADEEVPRLAEYLQRDFGRNIYQKMRRRSRTTGSKSALQHGGDPSRDWTRYWDTDDIRRVLAVITRFGLDEIYNDTPTPRAEGVRMLQARRKVTAA